MEFRFFGGSDMSDDVPRWASFSPAFSIVLSSARGRIAELGCAPMAVTQSRSSIAEACVAWKLRPRPKPSKEFARRPILFKLFGSDMPRGKKRKLVLSQPYRKEPWVYRATRGTR